MPDIVPPKKPYTTQQFQKKADLYIKGALGGFDKAEMKELLIGEIEKAKDAGILSTEEAMDFIRERSELLKEFIKENPGETLPDMTFVDGRVELKTGGNYWAMVTRMFVEAGAEEGTGMDINEFASKYFPRENNSGGTMPKSEKWMRDYFFSGKGGYDDRMSYQEFAEGIGQELYKRFSND